MILGIDPGKLGGLAVISDEGLLIEPMPINDLGVDGQELARILPLEDIKIAYVEKPFAMQKSSAMSMLSFGRAVGVVHGVLAIFNIPVIEVRPQTWMLEMYNRCPQTITGKHRSVWAFQQAFPGVSATEPGKKCLHLGMIEGALICEFGRRVSLRRGGV